MRLLGQILVWTFLVSFVQGQSTDMVAIYHTEDELLSLLLVDNIDGNFSQLADPFTARSLELAEINPRLTVSGDFTGDGVDEVACFGDLHYTPNLNPGFTNSVIMVYRSTGSIMIPSGTWFSYVDTLLEFDFVAFSASADYNQDGLDDIALFYNDPNSEIQTIYVLESTGNSFSEPKVYFTTIRNEFNFTALKFTCAGDFNGNGLTDIAVFYNYFGSLPETKQSIFLFESNGQAFSLLPGAYHGVKQDYDFSNMTFALSGDYNLDGITDIAVLTENLTNEIHSIPVFEGSEENGLFPSVYFTTTDSALAFIDIRHVIAGEFAGDPVTDLVLFYDNPASGEQEILVLEGNPSGFIEPVKNFGTNPIDLNFQWITSVQSGNFIHQPQVIATTWKNDKKGAISFTFDDGYEGAFKYGAALLDSAGLTGTLYIFTDTSGIYDAALAGTALIRKYKDKGFEIGSHTSNHSDLGYLTANQEYGTLNDVLTNSVDLLNERFDQNTSSMSIPFGSFRRETLEYISNYFYTSRSSQFGFNLATPFDFFALRSWPILSYSAPDFVDGLVGIAETYGYYLPLMYHDILNEPFDEDSLIYSYSADLFSETIQKVSQRAVWIDTHERVYKYIRERNSLNIVYLDHAEQEGETAFFSFIADDGLADTVFNVELTLKIRVPDSWDAGHATIGIGDSLYQKMILTDENGSFLLYNWLPSDQQTINVYNGLLFPTNSNGSDFPSVNISLLAYPNPFRNETLLTMEVPDYHNLRILVIDLQGRVMRDIGQISGSTYRLKRENLIPGLYFIQLFDSGYPIANLKLIAE